MQNVLIELQYLPSVEYFALLLQADKVYFEGNYGRYEKQSYRNRFRILTANKVADLSIPVRFGNRRRPPVREVEIDYNQKWLHTHWRTILSAYGKAPFFEYYIDFLEPVFAKKFKNLFELNLAMFKTCLGLLGLSLDWQVVDNRSGIAENVEDWRSKVHPKRSYIENGIIEPFSYTQVFGEKFVPNLSILDLLFCEGSNSLNILKKSLLREEFSKTK
ncbi:MAG: WbqC family protein [Cytophagales bacterium]|nr:WbqC family protein [Cytophagales bacterium]